MYVCSQYHNFAFKKGTATPSYTTRPEMNITEHFPFQWKNCKHCIGPKLDTSVPQLEMKSRQFPEVAALKERHSQKQYEVSKDDPKANKIICAQHFWRRSLIMRQES